MIISENPLPNEEQFNLLLNHTVAELNLRAKKTSNEISILLGNKLEPYIKDILSEQAKGTVFENSIELISGQKFPDIIANKFYGIEVKSTTQNHWRTTGNSVLESTRVDGIERIHMMFGKLASPIEFRCRPYHECLSEIIVTHSPRYQIDMNLPIGATIFDKMEMKYDLLRKEDNPIKSVVDYYKKKLKPGEDLWWIGQDGDSKASSVIIRIWNNLTQKEKHSLIAKSMAYFPELFSNKNDKYGRLAIWLITQEGIVCPNVRDSFTAGGKSEITIEKKTYKAVPRMIQTLIQYMPDIYKIILDTSAKELSEHWNQKTSERNKLVDWINLVSIESQTISDAKHLNIKEMINKTLLKINK